MSDRAKLCQQRHGETNRDSVALLSNGETHKGGDGSDGGEELHGGVGWVRLSKSEASQEGEANAVVELL